MAGPRRSLLRPAPERRRRRRRGAGSHPTTSAHRRAGRVTPMVAWFSGIPQPRSHRNRAPVWIAGPPPTHQRKTICSREIEQARAELAFLSRAGTSGNGARCDSSGYVIGGRFG